MEEGKKYDQGKLRYDLIPPDALDALARVYTAGAEKYGDRNWEQGLAWGRIFGAIMRHSWAFWRGEDCDKESGLPHMAHVAWGAFTLLTFFLRGTGKDDRNKLNMVGREEG